MQNRVAEQVVGVPVPRITEDFLPFVPQERVLKCTPEQLVDVPVPQILEAAVDYRFPEQIVNSPVPQFMEPLWRISSGSSLWIPCASVHGGRRGNYA